MPNLTIRNVGPIKVVEGINLNKVNVFMGPQSSGKSTIAKILSFCTWVVSLCLDTMRINNISKNIWSLFIR